MSSRMSSGTALVTGVGRRKGIGAAICRALAAQGLSICYTWWEPADRSAPWGSDEAFGSTFASELQAEGYEAHGLEANLADPEAPNRLVVACNDKFGEIRVLVNNAAVSEMGGIDELTAGSIDRHLAVNVRGMALLTQAFVRQFSSGRDGRVINMTSGQGLGPMPDELAYATSKGAVEAFTTSLAPAVAGRGITVNAVNPGPTDTGWMAPELRQHVIERTPSGRIGMPEDAARLIAFLASPEAGWITGQIISSEGGFLRG